MKFHLQSFPNISDIFNDNKVEGPFPDSMALMVCRLTGLWLQPIAVGHMLDGSFYP